MYADWSALGDALYRKIPLYDMNSEATGNFANFDDCLMCGAAFGGPIAMLLEGSAGRNKGKASDKTQVKPFLKILTTGGKLISEVIIY